MIKVALVAALLAAAGADLLPSHTSIKLTLRGRRLVFGGDDDPGPVDDDEDPPLGGMIALGLCFALFSTCGLAMFAGGVRSWAQAKGLSDNGKEVAGRVVNKRIEYNEGASYFLEVVFPVTHQGFSSVKKSTYVQKSVYDRYQKDAEVTMVYHERDPRFSDLAEHVREERRCGMVGYGCGAAGRLYSYVFAGVFVVAPFGWAMQRSQCCPLTTIIYAAACVLFIAFVFVPAAVCPFKEERCCKGRDVLGKLQTPQDEAAAAAAAAAAATVAAAATSLPVPVAAVAPSSSAPSAAAVVPNPTQTLVSVTVPANVQPGQQMIVQTPAGQQVSVAVPAGAVPGSVLQITV
jgi:hypothetical protein